MSRVHAWALVLVALPACVGGVPEEEQSSALGEGADACAGGDSLRTIVVGGVERVYRLHVPEGVGCADPVPLVVSFHGGTVQSPAQILATRMIEKSDDEGFIVAHPDGLYRNWNAGTCCPPSMFGVDDVGFARALVADVMATHRIDADRVYATGMSAGGMLTHRLACEAADVFAAFAPVSGNLMRIQPCTPSRPVPIMGFHGTDDWVVSYEPTSYYPGFRETLAGWAERNGCGTATRITYERGDSICETFDDCPEGVDVTRCTIEGGGHQWPGGRAAPGLGHMTRDLSATDAMWDFMVAHPRRP